MTKAQTGFDFNENLLGLWALDVSDEMNWMAGLSRTDESGTLLYKYRTRRFPKGTARNNRFDPNAEAQWVYTKIQESPEQAIEKIQFMARALSQHAQGDLIEVLRGKRSLEDFIKEITEQPIWLKPT
jgi:hypothetical protein